MLSQEDQGQSLFSPGELASHLVTRADFAREIGRSPARVTQYVAMGMPITDNGLIDRAHARAWMQENLAPNRRKGGIDAVPAEPSVRVQLDHERLELLRLEKAQRQGTLVERAAVERAVFRRFRFERDAWAAWCARTAPVIAARFGVDGVELATVLEQLVREHQAELAETPFSAAGDA